MSKWYKICRNGKNCSYDLIHDVEELKRWNEKYRPDFNITYEEVKVKRFSLEEIEEIVKKILSKNKLGMGTKELMKECHKYGLFLTTQTFLKKMNQINKEYDWLEKGKIGWAYVWYINDVE